MKAYDLRGKSVMITEDDGCTRVLIISSHMGMIITACQYHDLPLTALSECRIASPGLFDRALSSLTGSPSDLPEAVVDLVSEIYDHTTCDATHAVCERIIGAVAR